MALASTHAYDDLARDEILPFVPAGISSVLDVGCSFGAFGAAVKAAQPGVEVWGLEPRPEAAAIARPRLDHLIHGRPTKAL